MLIALFAALAALAPPASVTKGQQLLPTTLNPATALPAWPATLERVSQGPAGAVYIEPASIHRSGRLTDVREVSIPPQESDATSYMWSLERIDCSAKTLEKILYVRLTEDGRVLGASSSPPFAVQPGAQALERIARVCGGPADRTKIDSYASMPALLKVAWPIIDAELAKLPPQKITGQGN